MSREAHKRLVAAFHDTINRGAFIALPAFSLASLAPIVANASATAALFPGAVVSA